MTSTWSPVVQLPVHIPAQTEQPFSSRFSSSGALSNRAVLCWYQLASLYLGIPPPYTHTHTHTFTNRRVAAWRHSYLLQHHEPGTRARFAAFEKLCACPFSFVKNCFTLNYLFYHSQSICNSPVYCRIFYKYFPSSDYFFFYLLKITPQCCWLKKSYDSSRSCWDKELLLLTTLPFGVHIAWKTLKSPNWFPVIILLTFYLKLSQTCETCFSGETADLCESQWPPWFTARLQWTRPSVLRWVLAPAQADGRRVTFLPHWSYLGRCNPWNPPND